MDLATLEQLLTPPGRAALAAAAELELSETKYPAHFDRLRKHFGPDLARAALDTAMLRVKARTKFARAGEMFFTRDTLEMATSETVARYRAGWFAAYPTVADLCCGIGGDALALAAAGRTVVAVDNDPLRLRMAEVNLAAHGLSARFLRADILTDDLPPCDAWFADPERRAGGRRKLSVHEYAPPVRSILARLPPGAPIAVKVAPGLPREELSDFDADPEFISLDGELKECVLRFGPLRTGHVRATVLPGPHTLTGGPTDQADVRPVAAYLYDPDPAVTRGGLVAALAVPLGAHQIDPMIAFLSADHLAPTPFAAAYRVEETLPFHAKRVGAWLAARGVGRVTMVKRGSSVDTDELAAKWKLRGTEHRAVILTRAAGQAVAIVAVRVETAGCDPG
ncbi:class I SAM-dependent methyltransferase [Fimbriiglobus ruber]|uniref:THUMP-like domain-containing protein n=1 Tax=Fimbriiglobus ruber TaxID=1908690 RepID=A0A225E2X9_9BACT|nr:class I SAM-dependent methyltransferase [Fimbriiglobus ruber]OWK43839.1 hypothetical protein FRUB_03438 [Fimbriiglobus ruber]